MNNPSIDEDSALIIFTEKISNRKLTEAQKTSLKFYYRLSKIDNGNCRILMGRKGPIIVDSKGNIVKNI